MLFKLNLLPNFSDKFWCRSIPSQLGNIHPLSLDPMDSIDIGKGWR